MRPAALMLSICLATPAQPLAQSVSVVVQGGISSYGSASIGNLGGGGADHSWKTGPIVGVGAFIVLSKTFSVGATMEYSTHQYDPQDFETQYNATNMLLDLNGIGQLSFGIFDPLCGLFLGGIGLSYQDKDPTGSPGRSEVNVGALIGVGLAARLSNRVEVFLEGSWRIRTYVTPVVEMGLAYSL